jgi:hypothetical protein
MAKSPNRKNLFLQEFFAVLPDFSTDVLDTISSTVRKEFERRSNVRLASEGSNLKWFEALDLISDMANAECVFYESHETRLRSFLEARIPKGIVNKFLQRLGDVSNDSSEGVMTERGLSRFYDRAINLKKKYPKKRALKRKRA